MTTNVECQDEWLRHALGHGSDRATSADGLRQPHAALEAAFIDEFLAKRGFTLRSVDRLPPGDRQALLRAAATFATLKLAEIEARAHLLHGVK
jgi:hypothetical protein